MKALYFLGDSQAVVKEVPVPRPGPGEVLVQMKAAGLCGSDLHGQYERSMAEIEARNKRLGRDLISGHEPCGVVDSLGAGTRGIEVGDRVMVNISKSCGVCAWCRSGWTNLCKQRVAYGWGPDGCFADFMVAEDRNLVKMPEWLSYEVGAHLTCGGGTVYSSLRRLNIMKDEVALAVGLGPVGLGGVAIMKGWGAKVIGVDLTEERLKLAMEMGADEVIDASKENVLERVKALTDGADVNVAADFSGSPIGRNNCIDATGILGRVAFIGEQNQRPEMTLDPSKQLFAKRITLYSSRSYGFHELMQLLQFMEKHNVRMDNMITHRFPLEKGSEAFELFQTTKTGKVVFIWP